MAKIQLDQFHDSSRCLLSLRRALEYSPGHEGAIRELEGLLDDSEFFEEVSEVLESVYRTLNDTSKLAALFERRIGLAATPEERLEARRTLARVLEDEVGDTAAAQRILQQGVLEEPGNLAVLEELARLAGITGEWSAAAETLEEALYKVVSSEPATAKEIALTLANWRRERLHDAPGAERALGVALECAPESDEILELLEELQAAPGREQALIDTLRRRGKLATDGQREELFRHAKRLADGLRVPGLSESVLRDLLRLDESNDWALSSLAESLEEAQQYPEALALIERRIQLGSAPDPRELRHHAALLARERLADPAKARRDVDPVPDEVHHAQIGEEPLPEGQRPGGAGVLPAPEARLGAERTEPQKPRQAEVGQRLGAAESWGDPGCQLLALDWIREDGGDRLGRVPAGPDRAHQVPVDLQEQQRLVVHVLRDAHEDAELLERVGEQLGARAAHPYDDDRVVQTPLAATSTSASLAEPVIDRRSPKSSGCRARSVIRSSGA